VGVSMIELSADTGECMHRDTATGSICALDNGHSGQQLWGLACSSTDPEYCTVGEDRYFFRHVQLLEVSSLAYVLMLWVSHLRFFA
jgi:hypothetical protein